jgi:hypothetical protein
MSPAWESVGDRRRAADEQMPMKNRVGVSACRHVGVADLPFGEIALLSTNRPEDDLHVVPIRLDFTSLSERI